MIEGWYYLHSNGEFIYKRDLDNTVADLRESDFVKSLWAFDPTNRECVWQMLIEALAGGAKKDRVMELAAKWGCDDTDANIYAKRIGCNIYRDENKWCATDQHFENLQSSPAGFGETKLEAMSALANELGYKSSKMWAPTFPDLLNARENSQFGVGR